VLENYIKRIGITLIVALSAVMLPLLSANAAVSSHTLSIDAASDSLTLEGDDSDSATAVLTHHLSTLALIRIL